MTGFGDRPVGPRIARLAAEVERGEVGAVAAFWHEVEQAGTPLVEPADDPDYRLITFVWRDGSPDLVSVAVCGGPATWVDLERDAMWRLEGTDLWSLTYRVRSDLAGRYWIVPNDPLTPSDDEPDWAVREGRFRADPWNPRVYRWPANPADPTTVPQDMSILALPNADLDRWSAPRRDLAAGKVQARWFESPQLDRGRRVWCHVPVLATGQELGGVLVVTDGWVWAVALPLAPVLDALIGTGTIAPMLTVMVDALDDDARDHDLACDPGFLSAVCDELVPQVRAEYGIGADRERTAIAGQSLGGRNAAFTVLERPDVFGAAIVQSGSFWSPSGAAPDAETLTRSFHVRPAVGARIFMEVGLLEGDMMLEPSRYLRDVLAAKGYDLTYREYMGAHDWVAWRAGLARGLIALFVPLS